jgi:hypothetical protein
MNGPDKHTAMPLKQPLTRLRFAEPPSPTRFSVTSFPEMEVDSCWFITH